MEHKAAKKNFFSIWECIAFQVSKHYLYLKTRNLIIWTIKSWNYSGCKKAWGLLVQSLAQSSVGYLIRPGLLGLSSVRSWKPLRTEILQPLPLFRVFFPLQIALKIPKKAYRKHCLISGEVITPFYLVHIAPYLHPVLVPQWKKDVSDHIYSFIILFQLIKFIWLV